MTSDLDQGTQRWSLFVARCIYCARCEEVCPTGAIKLSQFFETAVMNKEDLYEQADYFLAACKQCGRYFAPAKELDYVLAILNQSNLPSEQIELERILLSLCPECKRKNDIPKLVEIYKETGL
jgi:hydrogenase-4 component H